MNYIGIDLGGTKILGALFDNNGTIIYKNKKKTKAKNGIKAVEEQLFSLIDDLTDKSGKEEIKATDMKCGQNLRCFSKLKKQPKDDARYRGEENAILP